MPNDQSVPTVSEPAFTDPGNYRKVRVAWDAEDNSSEYDAYVYINGEWNGFVIPFFDKSEGLRLVENQVEISEANPDSSKLEYLSEYDRFVETFPGDYYSYSAGATTVEGIGNLYPITEGWTWSIVKEYE